MSYDEFNSNVNYAMVNGQSNNVNSTNQFVSEHIIFPEPDAISRELFSYLLTDNFSTSSSPSSQDTSGTFPLLQANLYPTNLLYNPPVTLDTRFNQYPNLNQLSYDPTLHTPPQLNFISHPISNQLPTSPPTDLQTGTKKRPRRKHDEIQRNFDCIHPNCNKSYGTLSNLNHHITMQKHGAKRLATEFE